MKSAKFVKIIDIIDPDTNCPVEISVYKHENGGMFAIDSSYLEQCFSDPFSYPVIPDPFSDEIRRKEKIMLVGD